MLAERLAGRGWLWTGGFVANILVLRVLRLRSGAGFLQYRDSPLHRVAGVVDASGTRSLAFSSRPQSASLSAGTKCFGARTPGVPWRNFCVGSEAADGRPFFAFINFFDASSTLLCSTGALRYHVFAEPSRTALRSAAFKMPDFPDLTADEIGVHPGPVRSGPLGTWTRSIRPYAGRAGSSAAF